MARDLLTQTAVAVVVGLTSVTVVVARDHAPDVHPVDRRDAVPRQAAPATPTVDIRYRVDVRVPDGDGFAELLAATMADARGWSRAGFRVSQDPEAAFAVVLVEGDEAQRLCLPYDVGGEYSCQNGPVVVINANRWRTGVAHWPLSLNAYRVMLLNHEMGHLLGQHHRPCTRGREAPVMFQQSGSLPGCGANPWPTDDEIERAARHDLKLAPAFGE